MAAVSTRAATRHFAVCALLAGFVLRAATPIGYMPAALQGGLLFELCPGQLPAGFVMPGSTSTHEHHHHSSDGKAQSEPDTCQIGHLLSSAAAVDGIDAGDVTDLPQSIAATRPVIPARSRSQRVHRSRGPPA